MTLRFIPSVRRLFSTPAPPDDLAAEPAPELPGGNDGAIDLCMMFDTTGSMFGYIKEVRRALQQIAADVAHSHPDNRIGVIAYGDYCDRGRTYVVSHHPLTDDLAEAQHFVNNVKGTCGGDFPEAVEEALHLANALQWRRNCPRVAILVGDAPPHGVIDSRSKCKDGHFYLDEVHELQRKQVCVYTVQCGTSRHTRKAFMQIASATGGKHLQLEQIDDLPEIIVAACKHRTGDLAGYVARLEKEGRVTGRLRRQLASLDD